TRTDGTGLGLAMAKRVVEVHHGQLEAVIGRGVGDDGRQGACIRVSLPRTEPVGEDNPAMMVVEKR
ncbi:MAG: hypothetical protein AAFX99_37220, partial [Myxococcota bacterium]